jgi:hypothetical protein
MSRKLAGSRSGGAKGLGIALLGEALRRAINNRISEETIPRVRYVTYILYDSRGQEYIGRTSGGQFEDAKDIARARFNSHYVLRALGFVNFKVDKEFVDSKSRESFGYFAIRGREQQLIDARKVELGNDGYGNSRVVNKINGISPLNLRCTAYHADADIAFGNIAPPNCAF